MNDDLISRSAMLEKQFPSDTIGEEPVVWASDIENATAVDAVIPVRCGECKHFKRNLENDTYCSSVNGLSDPEEDDFCSYGERRADHE